MKGWRLHAPGLSFPQRSNQNGLGVSPLSKNFPPPSHILGDWSTKELNGCSCGFITFSFFFGEGNGTPLQYSCLENSMYRGAWWAAVHGVAKSRTRLSDFTFTFSLSCTGEGNGNPLQCSCLENPRDSGAWWSAVYRVAQSRTRLK